MYVKKQHILLQMMYLFIAYYRNYRQVISIIHVFLYLCSTK